MAWLKGVQEGYHAAKDDALAINPKLRCRAIHYQNYPGARLELIGFVVENTKGETVGRGKLSRDAWGDAFFKLGGRYDRGRTVLPNRRAKSACTSRIRSARTEAGYWLILRPQSSKRTATASM